MFEFSFWKAQAISLCEKRRRRGHWRPRRLDDIAARDRRLDNFAHICASSFDYAPDFDRVAAKADIAPTVTGRSRNSRRI
jgi:hypothetical protein